MEEKAAKRKVDQAVIFNFGNQAVNAGASTKGVAPERKAASVDGEAEIASRIVSLTSARKKRSRVKTPEAAKSVEIETHIGRQLKAIYDDVLNQPVPDRFLELIEKLQSAEAKKQGETAE